MKEQHLLKTRDDPVYWTREYCATEGGLAWGYRWASLGYRGWGIGVYGRGAVSPLNFSLSLFGLLRALNTKPVLQHAAFVTLLRQHETSRQFFGTFFIVSIELAWSGNHVAAMVLH